MINTTPATGEDGTQLTIAVPSGFNFSFYGSIQSYVLFFDISGAMKEPVKARVLIHGNQALEKGDFNGNHQIDLADSILALKILAGFTQAVPSYPVVQEAAMNGNEKIGVQDVIYDLQYISDLRQ